MSKPKIFVSYSRKDAEYLEELTVHLVGLKRNGKIELWTDQEIVASTVWEADLKSQLETTDIMIFLVSPDFIASDYIYDVEIGKAIERHSNGEVAIVPVIIRSCDFSSTPLTKFQALPKNLEPIAKWTHRDEAWMNVVDGLKRTIEAIGKQKHHQTDAKQESNENSDLSTNSLDAIRMKVAGGKIDEAINALLEITKGKASYNSVIMQSSKYNRAQKDNQLGILSMDEYKRSIAQIENALLAVVDELGLE